MLLVKVTGPYYSTLAKHFNNGDLEPIWRNRFPFNGSSPNFGKYHKWYLFFFIIFLFPHKFAS